MCKVRMFLLQTVIMILLFNTGLSQTSKLISYNIRYDNPKDGENIWENRKHKMASLLNYYEPFIFGMKKGEFYAILYDTTILQVIKDSTFWLSETPVNVSAGWDAALNRVCTYGLF